MDETKFEILLDENTNLKKTVASTKNTLERTLNDYETLKQIHEDFKVQYDKIRKENDEFKHKYLNILQDKKDLEIQFDNTIRTFKSAIEQKQKELEDVQNKVIPSMDYDMMRIKILNELEGPQRHAQEVKDEEIERLQDQTFELKRQVEVANSKYETIRFEAEKDIRELKERYRIETADLVSEMEALQEKNEDTRDKETIRLLKNQLEEMKFKWDDFDNDIEELRREKEKLKEEKNELLIKYNKQIEYEKSEKRSYKTENERLTRKIKELEVEISSFAYKTDDKESALSRMQRENDKMRQENDNHLREISLLQNQIKDFEMSLYSSQTKLQEQISQVQLQSHEKQISEKNKVASLRREIESYQNIIFELESKYRNNTFEATKGLETTRQELTRIHEAHFETQKRLDSKEKEVHKLKNEIDHLQNEFSFLQKKSKENLIFREAVTPVSGSRIKGGASEIELREALAREEVLKEKIITLKTKLKMANKKIMELLPYKALCQNNTNITYRPDVDVARPLTTIHASAPSGNLLSKLKVKYGIGDHNSSLYEINSTVPDVKLLSGKYGFRGGNVMPADNHLLRSEMRKIRDKYGYDDSVERIARNQMREEEFIQSEIKRTTEEDFKKYGYSHRN